MAKGHLKLVYSADVGQVDEKEIDFNQAEQMSLFDDLDANRLYVVALRELDRFELKNLISKLQPAAIFDTREYPEFYSFFKTDNVAISTFESLGANYLHRPIGWGRCEAEEIHSQVEQKLLSDLNELRERCPQSSVKCVVFVQANKGLNYFEHLGSSQVHGELENWKIQPASVALAH